MGGIHSPNSDRSGVERQRDAMVENAFDAVIGVAADLAITDWNRQAQAMFGFSKEHVTGKLLPALLVAPADQEAVRSYLARFFAIGEQPERRIELQFVTAQGKPLQVELTALALPEGERPLYLFARGLQPQTRPQDRFQVHFEHAAVSIQLLSPDGRTLAVNNAWRELWGIPDEFIQGYILKEYNLLKDQQLVDKGIMPYIERGFAGEATEIPPILYDPVALGSGGARRWVSGFIYPLKDAAGNITEVVLTHTDVTSARDALLARDVEQKKFESLFETSPAIMALVRGPDFVFEKTNAAYQQLIEHRDVIGKPLREALPELMDSPFPKILKHVFETGESFHIKEVSDRVRRGADGAAEEVYLDFTYQRVSGAEGEPYGIIGTAIDVTEQVKSRKRVEKLAGELQEAVRARDEFISICSHELKTPVTSMQLQFQMAAKQLAKGDDRVFSRELMEKRTDTANRQLARMGRLIEDMLDVSRITAGRLQVNSERLDLCEVMREVFERFSEQFSEAGMAIDFSGPPEQAPVLGDRYRLEQVISNLLTNALKYGGRKPVAIALTVEEERVRLSVKDQGEGIAPENHERIFGRFERAVSASKISGLGLGLYISRKIIEAHGGRIWVESEPGQGATFLFEVPRAKPE